MLRKHQPVFLVRRTELNLEEPLTLNHTNTPN